MRSYTTLLPTLALVGSAAAAYQYGDHKYEELEHLLVDNAGYNDGGFAAAVTPCSRYVNSPLLTTGRESAAQWQRVFFHDLSTGDIHAGTGGVDASIGFETMRAENKGAAMNDTLGWYARFYNQNVGMADMVALGVTVSSASCSGPKLVFKGGRIDAVGGGRTGVPEPEQPASEYFEAMEKIGLNKTEAIQFIACGHTIGSVHHSGFPEIQGPETVTLDNTNGGQSFDATVDVYDNSVVTQYLDGTTKNPLVVSFNETNRSDKRIFESDGNITMKDLGRSNAHFLDVCRNIYQKGIDTVPRGVTLFDITPITVKPVNVAIDVSLTGTVTFRGAVRLLGTKFASSSSRTVVIAWKGSDKKEYTVTASQVQTGASTYLHTTNYFYPFSATVKSTGVTSFVVRVTENGKTTTYDNGGKRFAVTDTVQFQPQLSAFLIDGATNSFTGTLAAAVRQPSGKNGLVGPVTAVIQIPTPVVGAMNPTLQSLTVPLNKVSSLGNSGYDLYTAQSGPFPLPIGANSTSRSVSLAKQSTLDITATIGSSTATDGFRKASEVEFTLH